MFSAIVQGLFLSVFSGGLIFRIVGLLGARGSPKGRFWETILKTFWGWGHTVRIELPPRRELDFQGFGGSKKPHIFTHFLEGLQGALWGGIFESYC